MAGWPRNMFTQLTPGRGDETECSWSFEEAIKLRAMFDTLLLVYQILTKLKVSPFRLYAFAVLRLAAQSMDHRI